MELTADLKQRTIQQVHHFVDLANKRYGINMSYPTITFDLRGTTAGMAYSGEHKVQFNAGLLVRNVDEMLEDTVPHEVAHLVTYRLHPTSRRWTGKKWVRTIKPHGDEWKSVMRALGVTPDRTHNMDVSEVRVKKNVTKYEYRCNCRTHEVGGKVHNKIQAGHTYTCRKCKGKLTAGTFVAAKKPVVPVVSTVFTPGAPAYKVPVTVLPKVGSKKERAEALYIAYKHDKQLCLSMFVNELDMTVAGARTYLYNCQKKFG